MFDFFAVLCRIFPTLQEHFFPNLFDDFFQLFDIFLKMCIPLFLLWNCAGPISLDGFRLSICIKSYKWCSNIEPLVRFMLKLSQNAC